MFPCIPDHHQANIIDPYLYIPRPLLLNNISQLLYLNAARIPLGNSSFIGAAQSLPTKKIAMATLATRSGSALWRPLNRIPAKINAAPAAIPTSKLN